MAESPDPYTAPVGTKLSEAQRIELLQRAANPQSATSVEEVSIANKKIPDTENVDATNPSREILEASRDYKYPLTISSNYPAKIIFTARSVEGIDVSKLIGDVFESEVVQKTTAGAAVGAGSGALLGGVPGAVVGAGVGATVANAERIKKFGESLIASIGAETVDPATAAEQEAADKRAAQSRQSYEKRMNGEKVGSVTLPLQRDLRFSDNAQYETANLGTIGGALEQGLGGVNPFRGATQSGQLLPTVSAIAASAIAKGAGEVVGAAVGSKLGTPGAIIGASALGGTLEGLSPAVRSATRIATAPNQRTLFQQVGIRSFAFTFKMIANNAREAEEIKNIVKFFRQELYPEKISLGESGVPLGYKFPNVFDIQVKNKNNDDAAFKIQQCYLRDIQTSFNSTASGMYNDGQFVEVDISLAFQEIVALDKQKVREGY